MDSERQLYNEIGKRIKKRRRELGLTQEQLADITNYSDSFIANIESSTYQSFSLCALYNIAHALNIPMKDLMPENSDIILNNKIKCEYCDYETKIPYELVKLMNNISDISEERLKLTCPNCHKKIFF